MPRREGETDGEFMARLDIESAAWMAARRAELDMMPSLIPLLAEPLAAYEVAATGTDQATLDEAAGDLLREAADAISERITFDWDWEHSALWEDAQPRPEPQHLVRALKSGASNGEILDATVRGIFPHGG